MECCYHGGDAIIKRRDNCGDPHGALMTKYEFECDYAIRSGVTLDWLHQNGMMAVECDCGEQGCRGWKMISSPAHARG